VKVIFKQLFDNMNNKFTENSNGIAC